MNSLNELGKKVEESNLNLGDIENNKKKMASENADLLRALQELENGANMLSKAKLSLADQLEEARAVADNEAKERQLLLGKYRNAEHEVSGMKDHYEEEVSSKENLARQLNKARQEADLMHAKYEKEGVAKAEELEMVTSASWQPIDTKCDHTCRPSSRCRHVCLKQTRPQCSCKPSKLSCPD